MLVVRDLRGGAAVKRRPSVRDELAAALEKIARLEAEAAAIVGECRDELQDIDNVDGPLSAVRWLRFAHVNLRMTVEDLQDKIARLEADAAAVASAPSSISKRRHLPDERASRTVKITVAGLDLYLTVGMYEDGAPGEVFVRAGGGWDPTVRALLDQWAIAVSVALQWGAEPSNLFGKFARQRFPPEGPASLDLGLASSPLDAIARWVLRTYYPENQG